MDVEQLELLKLVGTRLEGAGLRYMVSGSVAMNYYAQPRMTRDIDVVVELEPDDVATIASALGEDFYFDEDTIRDAIERRSMFNAIHIEKVLKIDFIVRKDEPFRIEELHRRRKAVFEGTSLWIVSPEDLVLSKLVWAKASDSEMQLRDVANILASVPGIDRVYLEKWAATLTVADLLARASSS